MTGAESTSRPLAVGEQAPDFVLRDQHGAELALRDLRGGPVLVVFYPYAFSGVCTSELRELTRDETFAATAEAAGASVVAISCDPVFTQRAFAETEAIDLPLLSDFWPHGTVAAAYGVLDEQRGCPRRSSYLLDGSGVVRWSVHHGLGEARTVEQHRAALAALAVQPG